MAQLTRIKASAGAGKTYALSLRFLELLDLLPEPSPRALRSIVAITFTNKAAAEMKERILGFLKELALETQRADEIRRAKNIGLSGKKAERWVDEIIRGYTYFNVRTIDSLLFSILRALSFELGLGSDLNVVFGIGDVFDRAFERLLDAFESEKELWRELLRSFLELDEGDGFYPEGRIRSRLKKLFSKLRASFGSLNCSHNWASLRSAAEKRLEGAYKQFVGLVEPYKSSLNKKEVKENWLNAKDFKEILAASKKLCLKDPEKIFKKRCPKPDPEDVRKAIEELRCALSDYAYAFCASKVSGYGRFLKRLSEVFAEICREESIIIGGEDWIRLVRDRIREEGVIPLVYAYFGTSFSHFLFDEFQDTSRQQWETLFPIIDEVLSRDGSLFVVGDVKQAIYRWRGGDWDLFDELMRDDVFPSAEKREKRLSRNYRSAEKMVEFYNKFFLPLSDKSFVEECLGEKMDVAEKIALSFSESSQEAASGLRDARIAFYRVSAANKEEFKEKVKKRLTRLVRMHWKIWEKNEKPIAVLVRENKEAEEVTSWLVAAEIPVVTENALRLGFSPVVKGVLGLMSYMHDGDETGLYGFLASGLYEEVPSEEDLFEIWIDPVKRKRIEEEVRKLVKHIFDETGRLSPYEVLLEILEKFGVLRRLENDLLPHRPFVERLMEITHLFEVENGSSYADFIDFLRSGGLEGKIGLPEGIEAVHVMTIHKAKGLEFSVVFVPFADWGDSREPVIELVDGVLVQLGELAKYNEVLNKKRLEVLGDRVRENLNLLYVALTRAVRGLYVFARAGQRRGRSISGWVEKLLSRSSPEEVRVKDV